MNAADAFAEPRMPATWTHPELGRFTYDESVDAWVRLVDVPAFKAFTYDTGYPEARRPTAKHELYFHAADPDDKPSKAAVALASRVLANEAALVPKVVAALWDDFTGRGPDSGMWWHGDLAPAPGVASAFVDMMLDKDVPPTKAGDLFRLMHLSRIYGTSRCRATTSRSPRSRSTRRSSRSTASVC